MSKSTATPDDRPEKKKKSAPSFEQLLAELDATVQKMESGELSLDESLACFERGVALTRECQKILNDAERRIEKLMQELPGDN